jgi:hypothetical protein
MKERERKYPKKNELPHKDIDEIQTFLEYSKPQLLSQNDLFRQYGSISLRDNTIDVPDIVPSHRKIVRLRNIGESDFLKIREETYRRIMPSGEPHYFDTQRWITYEYDERHFLIKQKDMTVGKLGHIYHYTYSDLPDGRRVLAEVTAYEMKRQGAMNLGPIIGKPVTIRFAHLHEVSQKTLEETLQGLKKETS